MVEVSPLPRNAAPVLPHQRLSLIVDNMTCGSCMAKVERTLQALHGVSAARVNLSARRVSVEFEPGAVTPRSLVDALAAAGYHAADVADVPANAGQKRERELLIRIGIAGFAAANIMLLSVSVWAGMLSDMGPGVSGFFHWVSALIALPAIAYAGQPFFQSALGALRARRFNMDVPIAVAISLATGMSLFQTLRGSEQVYFDAAVSLLFFLLIGRFLDQRVRVKAAGAAQHLMALRADWASVIGIDGAISNVPARALEPGMRVQVAAGARVPADGIVRRGTADLDEGLITGETTPRSVGPGDAVFAGTVDVTGPIEIEVTAAESNTLLAEIGRLMEAAEQGRGLYVRLADRAARIYAPLVHLLGLATFVGWLVAGYGWEAGLTAAIAVLIITCPCALALAVPAVQVAAASRLFGKGLILKAPDGLERLAEIDTIVFDKTGTLTLGEPQLLEVDRIAPDVLRRAASLASASRHPYSRALVRAATDRLGPVAVASGVTEHPGLGLSRSTSAGEEQLGSTAFAGAGDTGSAAVLWYAAPGQTPIGFNFRDQLRPDAAKVMAALRAAGYQTELLSGDSPARAEAAAIEAGITAVRGGQSPAEKIGRLAALKNAGRRVLMVGDGLNDAPALAAAHASLSPATAADISQTAADVIWRGGSLAPIVELLAVARESRRMALQNFAIALTYNAVCVPLAMLGFVTPLIAALAMSTSSIAVTANALRLRGKRCRLEARS